MGGGKGVSSTKSPAQQARVGDTAQAGQTRPKILAREAQRDFPGLRCHPPCPAPESRKKAAFLLPFTVRACASDGKVMKNIFCVFKKHYGFLLALSIADVL